MTIGTVGAAAPYKIKFKIAVDMINSDDTREVDAVADILEKTFAAAAEHVALQSGVLKVVVSKWGDGEGKFAETETWDPAARPESDWAQGKREG
jgi:hypothetical protein